MSWGLVIASRTEREIRRVPADDLNRIQRVLREMPGNPFSGDVKYLRGSNALRRHVGDRRILYELADAEGVILVTAVGRRRTNAY
jgi:mRNA-degrading endonuclease RelE of RelBE toxin-antitoxin system